MKIYAEAGKTYEIAPIERSNKIFEGVRNIFSNPVIYSGVTIKEAEPLSVLRSPFRYLINTTFRNCKLVDLCLDDVIFVNCAFVDCDFSDSPFFRPMLAYKVMPETFEFSFNFIFFTGFDYSEGGLDYSIEYITSNDQLREEIETQDLTVAQRHEKLQQMDVFNAQVGIYHQHVSNGLLAPVIVYSRPELFAYAWMPGLMFLMVGTARDFEPQAVTGEDYDLYAADCETLITRLAGGES